MPFSIAAGYLPFFRSDIQWRYGIEEKKGLPSSASFPDRFRKRVYNIRFFQMEHCNACNVHANVATRMTLTRRRSNLGPIKRRVGRGPKRKGVPLRRQIEL